MMVSLFTTLSRPAAHAEARPIKLPAHCATFTQVTTVVQSKRRMPKPGVAFLQFIFTAQCIIVQSAVLRLHVVRPSV